VHPSPVLAAEDPPTFLDKWGSTDYEGYDPGYFRNPQGMAVDTSSGCLYVADSGNCRVQKFDGSDWTVFAGSTGSMGPSDVAVDSYGNVYVADSGNNRIQKFDSSGTFIREWGGFNLPQGVAVDSVDNVYVSDYNNCCIKKFDSDGGYLTQWGTDGPAEGQFHYPWGIAVDVATDNVYVTDCGENHHRVQEFTSAGEFIRMWGSQGAGDSQFSFPQGIAVDASSHIYVADAGNNRIQKFDSDGTFLTTWGTAGSLDGQFSTPAGVAVDPEGTVYVADTANWRVQSFGEAVNVEGDANGDGATNIIDAMFIAQYTVGLRTLDATQLLCADTTDDGMVNIIDAMHVAQFSVDPTGAGGVLFKQLWETPADDDLLDPLDL
jgi:DNA-binding beta-propeller fold protein YncE